MKTGRVGSKNSPMSSNLQSCWQRPVQNMFEWTKRHEAGDRNNKCSHERNSKQTFNGLKLQHETHLTQHVSALLCYNNNGSHHTKECHNINVYSDIMYCESFNLISITCKGSVCYKSTKQHISTMWTEISILSTIQCICECLCVLSLSDDVLESPDISPGVAGALVPVVSHN